MKRLLSLLVLGFASTAANAGKVRYDGYKVHRVVPQNEEHLSMLRELGDLGALYWHEPSTVGKHADVMFPPHMKELLSSAQGSGMQAESFIDNVQQLIDDQIDQKPATRTARLTWDNYYELSEIYNFLDDQAAQHSSIASVISIGKSFENRDLRLLKVSRSDKPKPAIWVDANIHAREWITSSVATYLINQLLNGNATGWTNDFDWYILPIHNPDGFVYSHETDRLWRKTRSNSSSRLCKGADANRNYGFHWMDGGSSSNPCSETYAGREAFSEPETRAVANFIDTIQDHLVFYLSLHSYSQLILFPYGHDNTRIPQYDAYMELAQRAADAHYASGNTVFTPGNIVDMLYVASGGSMDYVKGTYNTNLTLTYELRDTGHYGFLLPPDQITPSSVEFINGMQIYINALKQGIDTPNAPFANKKIVSTSNQHDPITKPAVQRPVKSLIDRTENCETFGTVPHPQRGLSPLEDFRNIF